MSLRLKIGLVVLGITILLFAGLYHYGRNVLLDSFIALENQYVLQQADSVQYAIQDQVEQLNRITGDWAPWDETYLFVLGQNPVYIERNLVDSTYENLKLSFVAIMNRGGEILYAEEYNPDTASLSPVNPTIRQWLLLETIFNRLTEPQADISGIVSLQGEIYQVSARPVVTSNLTGPIVGYLVMGKRMDARDVEALLMKMHISSTFDFHILEGNNRISTGSPGNTSTTELTTLKILNEEEIQSTTTYVDLRGVPAFKLDIISPRRIYQHGRTTLFSLLVGELFISLISGALLFILLNNAYVGRLMQLVEKVRMYPQKSPQVAEISMSGDDEVKVLANQINQLIGAIRKSSRELEESQQRYALVVQASNDGIWDWNLREDIFYYSERLKILLGYPPDSRLDSIDAWFERVHPDDRTRLRADIFDHIAGKTELMENQHRIRLVDGSLGWVLVRGLALRDGHEPYRLAGSFTNITQQKQIEERLRHDAMHDPLTDLFNRAYFMDQLARVIEVARRNRDRQSAFLYIDLDRFKLVNDSLGHEAGDLLLITVADRLRNNLRPSDCIARFGGDEFGVLIEDIRDIGDATRTARRLQEQIKLPIELQNQQVFTTISIGIATTASGYQRAEDMLRDADSAMYRAKANGKDCFEIFDGEMHKRNLARLTLESELHHALLNGEFQVYYQPIITVSGRRLASFEALIRWKHPDRGLVLPGKFIGLAEETGLSVPLNEWVIQAACTQLKQWKSQGYLIDKIAVNLSARQLRDPELPRLIRDILIDTELPPACLELEIPESAAMENLDQTVQILGILHEMGVHLTIDDFGTSYSSLAHLKRFAVSSIKIDRTFIRNIPQNKDDASLTSAIIAMAHILSKRVVAEGVETDAQLEFLVQQECDEAQGFLFSKALPPEQAEQWLTLHPMDDARLPVH